MAQAHVALVVHGLQHLVYVWGVVTHSIVGRMYSGADSGFIGGGGGMLEYWKGKG